MSMNTISNHGSAIHHQNELLPDQVSKKQSQQKNVPLNKEANNMPVKEVSRGDVKSTVEKLNDFIDPIQTNLKFVFHEDLHEYYVTVVNPLTDEIIREIPPKKMLDMYAAMTEYMGLLVDEKI
ncbi:flagellar protein FlaG [Pseudogracilibacillus sp. SE30717A]|uniref:flagellar protein FlaG n=1 Tax=Pseudogracilibacillus sp. SE30717A TaxID=3098293 RepID=UPI00300E051F